MGSWRKSSQNTSVNRRLIKEIALGMVGCLLVLSVLYVYSVQIRRRLDSGIYEELEEVSGQNHAMVGSVLQSKLDILSEISKRITADQRTSLDYKLGYLAESAKTYGFKRIGIMNREGKAYTSDDETYDARSESYYSKALQGESYISARRKDPLEKETQMIVFSVAVYNAEGEVNEILFAAYDVDVLEEMLRNDFFRGDSYYLICDSHGQIILNTREGKTAGRYEELAPKYLERTGVSLYDDGENYVCVHALDINDWYVVSFVSSNTVAQNKASIMVLNYLLCTIIFSVYILTVFYIQRARKRNLQLQDSENRALEASRAKSDFLANMSHEIRTPMNAIVGMCELILREPDISKTVREYCYNIQNSGRSLLSIINDILDFSKIESGKMELVEDEFNIASMLNDVINMAVTRKGDKNLELVVHVDPDLPVELIGDEIRIRQIITNLVTNGIKYTREGCVSIRVSQSRHSYGINLSVSVSDTGIGITEENLGKLFASFQQVDTKKNRSVEGTGLGLVISKRLITQMGGFINVSSVYGEGTEFRFVIPLKVKNAAPFVSVKGAERIHAAGYIDFTKYENPRIATEYRTLIGELRDHLHADIRLFVSMEEMKRAAGEHSFTHLFAAREEYLAEKAFFEQQAGQAEVIIVQDRANAVPVPDNIKCMFKPFYTLSVAAVFNHDSILTNLYDRKEFVARFVAPRARVLVVDDNQVNLQVATGLMHPYNMQVSTVCSARAAITMLRSQDYHLVFMDHMMPEMDGVEATRVIRQMEGDFYQKLPIIALTANAVSGVRDSFLAAGMNDFIAKPIEIQALDRVLRAWLPEELLEKPSEPVAAAESEAELPVDEETFMGDDMFSPRLGLSFIAGDKDSYYGILKTYVEKGEGKLDEIQKFFDGKQWAEYVIEVHALKSTSLIIGSKMLSELAKELEQAGKAGRYDRIEEKNESLLEMYRKVMEAGAKFLEAAGIADEEEGDAWSFEIGDAAELDEEKFAALLERIAGGVMAFDGDSIVAACGEIPNSTFHGVHLRPLLKEIVKAAEDFEFDEVEKKVQELKDILHGKEES